MAMFVGLDLSGERAWASLQLSGTGYGIASGLGDGFMSSNDDEPQSILDALIAMKPDKVIYRSSGDDAVDRGTLARCERHGVACEAVDDVKVRKFATGNRKATDGELESVIRTCWGLKPLNTQEAFAHALARYGFEFS